MGYFFFFLTAGTSERKISFALGGEDEDSHHSSTTELNQEPVPAKEEIEKKSKYYSKILTTGPWARWRGTQVWAYLFGSSVWQLLLKYLQSTSKATA